MSNGIGDVVLVKKWVFEDLSSSSFGKEEKEAILDGVDDIREDLVTWNRPITKCLKILENTGSETIYRSRDGDLRSYYVRRGGTMYCIGAGKRRNTYERDLPRMVERSKDY
ncbi:hypothetical protein [Halorussus salinus]|uniref:hypothetical protein n=1 Tax=Halorussus salinus TaxID=1364935 RepID=UPI0010931F9C|nr:hypothetical protein [Halorussus salinus]